jgi:hypothetical protein
MIDLIQVLMAGAIAWVAYENFTGRRDHDKDTSQSKQKAKTAKAQSASSGNGGRTDIPRKRNAPSRKAKSKPDATG